MAKEDDELVVNVDDADVVTVNIEDNPELAEEDSTPDKIVAKDKKEKEPRTRQPLPRTPLVDPASTGPTPEEALVEAQAQFKREETARKAAEATAASERHLREQAQRDAQQHQQTAEQFRERADSSELAVIENGIASAQRDLEAQEAEYTRAAEAGEFAKMASIQTRISKAAAALDRLETAKSTFAVRKTETAEGRVDAPVPPTNQVEQFLSQFAPAAQNWLRMHPDCMPAQQGGDPIKNSKMMAGHYEALARNVALNTPEYFKVIEEYITPPITTITQPTSRAADIQVADSGKTTPSVRTAQPSAPVSRDAPQQGAPRNVREVRLTKDQQEMARVSFPHLPESQAYGQYARNLIELEAEGKIGRLTH